MIFRCFFFSHLPGEELSLMYVAHCSFKLSSEEISWIVLWVLPSVLPALAQAATAAAVTTVIYYFIGV